MRFVEEFLLCNSSKKSVNENLCCSLDACRDVESLQHVARNEQRRNDVERDRHLVETTSEHLNESVADETQCHTFCNVVGQDHGEHRDEAGKCFGDVEQINVLDRA